MIFIKIYDIIYIENEKKEGLVFMIINNKRALAYVEKIAWVKPIEGADNIELIGIKQAARCAHFFDGEREIVRRLVRVLRVPFFKIGVSDS